MRIELITLLLWWTIFSFGADDNSKGDRSKHLAQGRCNEGFEALGHSTGHMPRPAFSKYPNEIEIFFRRKNGELITEMVKTQAKTKIPGGLIYTTDPIYDADKPGSQSFPMLPEESVAKAAEKMAELVNRDGIYKAVVKVDDSGGVIFLETMQLSQEAFDLQRTLQRKLKELEDEE